MMITGTTQLLGVMGDPIAHSLSPVMHNAAITHLGLDYVYLPFAVAPQDLATAVSGFRAIGLRGFNVTIPHKQAILPWLNQISEVAQAIGAINTVSWTDQGWYGTNTDVAGFLAPLKGLDRDWSQTTAVILGHGGAARAVVAGCAQLGFAQIQVVGRNSEKLQAFQASWGKTGLIDRLTIGEWADLAELLPQTDLLVNTTPIGMHPQTQTSPLKAEDWQNLPTRAIAYDLIYTPRPTLFLQQADRQGLLTLDGLEMLVQQGAAALSLWLQQPAPVEVMRQALLAYLDRRGKGEEGKDEG
ncbi:MAG: shikimate dehydrogenase [Elainella sp. Prado103]|jgi:shikimate dehydrogenase|nr:shikimate dehydrogenase [Elainella sp. Prado103]